MTEPRLRLIDGVAWADAPIRGERTRALLLALVDAGGRVVSEERLADEIWADARPENPVGALQVVVSRARKATSADVVARTDGGYRLALDRDDVDVWRAEAAAETARRALAAGDAEAAERAARIVRDAGRDDDFVLGRALEAQGRYAEALPLLREAAGDADAMALLRSVAAVDGVPAALARYEQLRDDLADRLGVDPSPELQALHRELLARDRPVRSGIRYETSSLVGRGRDIEAVSALLRRSRVTTLLGPGGLGKTRLANVLAREADQPVVHVVELVGVTAADEVVAAVGSAIGVRDSVSSRHALTPAQRSDIRGRIAEQLAQAPTLLVLDNCEHVVEAVAELAAFLVSAASSLTILTTSRAPLAIAAERVYPLGQLGQGDAAALFAERATAARPGTVLRDEVVRSLVTRLDGLPLAIELAAARIRSMSAEEILRRLDDRFALLRGGDRSAPDRHQTLLAVIDWSWNLLSERERRGLRRLAVFQDGFALDGAQALLDDDATDAVAELAAQSLLTVADADGAVRYRMLETVREFGLIRLRESDEEPQTRLAQRGWAVALADRTSPRLYGPDQLAAIDALSAEEANLADTLHRALGDGDRPSVVRVFAALGGLGGIRGGMPRIRAITESFAEVIDGWEPPDDLVDVTRAAIALALFASLMRRTTRTEHLERMLVALGDQPEPPLLNAMIAFVQSFSSTGSFAAQQRCAALVDSPHRAVRALGWLYVTQERENAGHTAEALEACRTALEHVSDDDGPWVRASALTMLTSLHGQEGDTVAAARCAREALPLLERIGAGEDSVHAAATIALAEIEQGDLEQAGRDVERLEGIAGEIGGADRGSALLSRAQLAIAQGRIDEGLELHRRAVARSRVDPWDASGPGSDAVTPWVLAAESSGLVAEARYAEGEAGRDLFDSLLTRLRYLVGREPSVGMFPGGSIDFPITGLVLFGLGLWALRRQALPAEDAIRLLVLAEGFGYPRLGAPLRWKDAVEDAERASPGTLAGFAAEYDGRRGADLLEEARAAILRVSADR
ncbi:AAA family ATPase [Microbacterium halotolerans]|uniref:AAA family ATPase n=1 Tax=Microbacterium halotolerans TaxID=246613 RepID=UPI0019692A2D|nr:AAA family ATPase [Microbacterium halotolerans]